MARDDNPAGPLAFDPVPVKSRHDGWTPEKQSDFIEALAESACVDEACKRVGMSTQSAYALRRRIDAQSFRIAWDAALDYGIRRLSDAAFSRALNGVVRPVFYQGEQIGERRYFDERLTMFLLRYRDPKRYGAWLDNYAVEQPLDGPAILLSRALDRVALDGFADEAGQFPPKHPPFPSTRIMDEDEQEERCQRRLDAAANALNSNGSNNSSARLGKPWTTSSRMRQRRATVLFYRDVGETLSTWSQAPERSERIAKQSSSSATCFSPP